VLKFNINGFYITIKIESNLISLERL